MDNKRKISGSLAKREGHKFEHLISEMLNKLSDSEFEVDGRSNTKIDVKSVDEKLRFSVKNPSGKNTQVGLYSQKSFIECLKITDADLLKFINQFFGGPEYCDYPRHRMLTSNIDQTLNDKFTVFLNEKTNEIIELLLIKGNNQIGDVNYMIWATEKNNTDNIIIIDLNIFKDHISKGQWKQNESTFEYNVGGKKIFHLQMKGSGKKYTNEYHSMMFHIHNNFTNESLVELKQIL